MTRSSIIGLMALLLAACASIPEAPIIMIMSDEGTVSEADASPVSEELECLSDCLGGGDSSGEICVARCL